MIFNSRVGVGSVCEPLSFTKEISAAGNRNRRPGAPKMEKKKFDTLKKQLEQRRDGLRAMMAKNAQDGREVNEESAQDIADRASSSYTKEFLFTQSANDRNLLQMVEGALVRINEGTYGECVSCGNEINAKRLEAVPWARHCIACQEKQEKGELEATR
jgi:DnaK suppressor protein